MGIWSWITGGNVNNVIDKVSAGVDKAIFTDEEKSDAQKKVLDWTLEYVKATQYQSIARRIIALIVTSLWCLLIIVGVIAKAWHGDDLAKYVFNVISENVNEPFSIILAFYFLAHVVKGLGKK